MQIEVMLFAVVGDFFLPGLGFHLYPYPIPTKKSKLTNKKPKKQKWTSVFFSLKMSHNEFPTKDLPEAYAPGQHRGWIQTTPIKAI